MNRSDMERFAHEWAASWNQRDIEAVLAHFTEDCLFTSPKAQATMGTTLLRGKAALRTHWSTALSRISALHYTLDHIVWDEERRELGIVYDSVIDGNRCRACELVRFGADGHVIEGDGLFGAPLPGGTR